MLRKYLDANFYHSRERRWRSSIFPPSAAKRTVNHEFQNTDAYFTCFPQIFLFAERLARFVWKYLASIKASQQLYHSLERSQSTPANHQISSIVTHSLLHIFPIFTRWILRCLHICDIETRSQTSGPLLKRTLKVHWKNICIALSIVRSLVNKRSILLTDFLITLLQLSPIFKIVSTRENRTLQFWFWTLNVHCPSSLSHFRMWFRDSQSLKHHEVDCFSVLKIGTLTCGGKRRDSY